MAGGVAHNCVSNGRVLREGPFEEVWIQPAAGDAGSAVGAALWWWHQRLGHPHERRTSCGAVSGLMDGMSGGALGPTFSDAEITTWAQGLPEGDRGEIFRTPDLDQLCDLVAEALADGAIVGWFDGALEFGPRALGHRSILADPRSATVQHDLNDRVKGRESFRPFAPAVMWEHAPEWFDIDRPAPYMVTTHQVRADRMRKVENEPSGFVERVQIPRSEIPACTHIDGSSRVQTVHEATNPRFHRLLNAFYRLTGCPILVNTSFNRAGQPIVCTPDEALETARVAGLDMLVVSDHVFDLSGRVRAANGLAPRTDGVTVANR